MLLLYCIYYTLQWRAWELTQNPFFLYNSELEFCIKSQENRKIYNLGMRKENQLWNFNTKLKPGKLYKICILRQNPKCKTLNFNQGTPQRGDEYFKKSNYKKFQGSKGALFRIRERF